MNYFIFIFKSAIEDFKRNKTRTFLTSLGILIGVLSVVLLTAFGLGLKKYIKDQFDKLGTDKLLVLPGQTFGEGGGLSGGGGGIGGVEFTEKDVTALKKISGASLVVPTFMKTLTVEGNGNSEIVSIQATTHDSFQSDNLEVDIGKIFEKADLDNKKKVAVLGPKIAKKLFGEVDQSINKIIKIQNQSYKVIGVLKPLGGGGFGGPDFDSLVYIPYKSALSFNPDKKFYSISINVADKEYLSKVKEEAKNILLKNYKDDEFSVIEMTEILNTVTSIFAVVNIVLVAIAAISLLVGGIGIMNIMYVSVIERTREIGIRRSFGALRRDILFQFLTEAVILSLIGGLLGLFFAYLSVLIINNYFPAYIDLSSVLTALFVSSAIGILFGVFPARRASYLSPIEAIRYE